MKIKALISLACLGVLAGLLSVFAYREKASSPLQLHTQSNPYENGIYATGVIESFQFSGQNTSIYPQISGIVKAVYAHEGSEIKKGDPILTIDDADQQAQLEYACANLDNVTAHLQKLQKAYSLNPQAISQDELDSAAHAEKIAKASKKIAQISLEKCTVRSPMDAVVLSMNAAVGELISPLGNYNTYSMKLEPIAILAPSEPYLAVRCFVDESLIQRIPPTDEISATLFIRGDRGNGLPLEFERLQPITIPKIQLTAQRQERVDIRVLPIIFKFKKPQSPKVFPGQIVDVYIRGKQ